MPKPTKAQLIDLIERHTNEKVVNDDTTLEALGYDSLSVADLAVHIEAEFDTHISDAEIDEHLRLESSILSIAAHFCA